MAPKHLWKLTIVFCELVKADSSKPLHIILKGQTDQKYSYTFPTLLIIFFLDKMAVLFIYLYIKPAAFCRDWAVAHYKYITCFPIHAK